MALGLSELEAAKISASALAGAADISAGWFFSMAPLNMPGPPRALLLSAPARRAGVFTGEWNPRLCAVDCTILQTVQPRCSGGGGGVSRRTFDFPEVFAGRSANIVILLLVVLKAELVTPSCGTGAEGRLFP